MSEMGARLGSYGSLLPIQTTSSPPLPWKPSKMSKEKERLSHWLFKFAGRKKVGMLLLCVISAAVTGWVIYVGNNKGEDPQDASNFVRFDNNLTTNHPVSSPLDELGDNMTSTISIDRRDGNLALTAPPSAKSFFGLHLPPGHPCNNFTLPPPPADKKRIDPRPNALMPKFPSPSPVLKNLSYISEEELSRDGEFGGSELGGFPTLKQRNDSYHIRESMRVHCGQDLASMNSPRFVTWDGNGKEKHGYGEVTRLVFLSVHGFLSRPCTCDPMRGVFSR